VAEFLTDAWVAELRAAAAVAQVPRDLHLVVQQVVLADRGDETAFVIRVADGAITVEPGRADDADLSFTQDRATAAAIAKGELSAQAAFMAGRLRVGGDLRRVLDRARALVAVEDLFAAPRAATAW
jgi:putative sterol carrier protein